MKIIKKKKLSIKKIILIILTIFVALLVLISLFAGNYLVNYSIGRSGDGGNRTVALEIPETADDTERTIAERKIAQQEANETFLAENPGSITLIDSLLFNLIFINGLQIILTFIQFFLSRKFFKIQIIALLAFIAVLELATTGIFIGFGS